MAGETPCGVPPHRLERRRALPPRLLDRGQSQPIPRDPLLIRPLHRPVEAQSRQADLAAESQPSAVPEPIPPGLDRQPWRRCWWLAWTAVPRAT